MLTCETFLCMELWKEKCNKYVGFHTIKLALHRSIKGKIARACVTMFYCLPANHQIHIKNLYKQLDNNLLQILFCISFAIGFSRGNNLDKKDVF